MDKELKHAALKRLAETDSETAEIALQKMLVEITSVFQTETSHDHISEQLESLDIIAYRVHEQAITAIYDLLQRLENLELTHEESPVQAIETLRTHQTNYKLMVEALKVLERLRYHDSNKILDIFFEYSYHTDETIAKQAKHGIEKLTTYDLDIFSGDGKGWPGLGLAPQEAVLGKIKTFSKEQKQRYFDVIVIACSQILSPTLSATDATYKKMTFRTGAIPAADAVKTIRKDTLKELKTLYALANNIEQKKAVLNAMKTATHMPNRVNYGDDIRNMILTNATTVANFMCKLAASNDEDMQILQKIEHDAYWLFYHLGPLSEALRQATLKVRDSLRDNDEYQIFRILIGFESIFHDWENGSREQADFEQEREFRETKACELAESINIENYQAWQDRITRYASIESNDLATFPYFGKFLEHFGNTSPTLALRLLSERSDQLEGFISVILRGIDNTDSKADMYKRMDTWCNDNKHLFGQAKLFEFSTTINEELLSKILDKAKSTDDRNTLSQIIASVTAQYNDHNKQLVQKFFMPALQALTKHRDTRWIFGFWFRKQRGDLLIHMDKDKHQLILDNLLWLAEIDYDAEEIVYVIAEQSPDLVIKFFCDRLDIETNKEFESDEYSAIPYEFHKLSEPLSQHPDQIIDALLKRYDENDALFTYREAEFVKNAFPDFPQQLDEALCKIIKSEEERNLHFVIDILKTYHGEPVIHNVFKAIIKRLPENSALEDKLIFALQKIGIVTGEYGFVEAYKQKREEVQPWLSDASDKVRTFAKQYIERLEQQIEREQQRADEDIILQKHQYGTDLDNH